MDPCVENSTLCLLGCLELAQVRLANTRNSIHTKPHERKILRFITRHVGFIHFPPHPTHVLAIFNLTRPNPNSPTPELKRPRRVQAQARFVKR